ncbi:chymotrypsin-2-like [Aphidius gifuensis]|uniref:chymotrypsin-2-like n=1 Tax=Aphidius gifuensis TaxID=684658 RepID=UPI001CDB92A1|nr:chymotrypsin-2-like [Aphidius gifuensis]
MKKILFIEFLICAIISLTNAKSFQERIINGIIGDYGEFPYQVSIRKIGRREGHTSSHCSGVIISNRHILTAGHCISFIDTIKNPAKELVIVVGTNAMVPGSGITCAIKSVTPHPKFTGTFNDSMMHDIGIITLEKELVFSPLLSAVKLPERDGLPDEIAMASGWGILSYPNGLNPINIMKTQMTIISSKKCQDLMGFDILDGQMCAFSKKGTGLCNGDSGGPLVKNGEVIGIASYVIPCAQNVPDVYSRVYYYNSWIKSIISKY